MTESAKQDRAYELFDLLVDGPQTYETACAAMRCTRAQFNQAVQFLRDDCAATNGAFTVTCDPQGYAEPWLYTLRHGAEVNDPESTGWVINRLGDAERRLMTISHVLAVAARVLPGRSIEARKARIFKLHIERAQEEVAMLLNGEAP